MGRRASAVSEKAPPGGTLGAGGGDGERAERGGGRRSGEPERRRKAQPRGTAEDVHPAAPARRPFRALARPGGTRLAQMEPQTREGLLPSVGPLTLLLPGS